MENKTPEEILSKYEDNNEYHFHNVDRKWIIQAIEEYGKQQYNQAVLDCIKNANVKMYNGDETETDYIFTDCHLNSYDVNVESMKKLLKQ